MCGTVIGNEESNKKETIMMTIGGIAAANLRRLYLQALLPEREGHPYQGRIPFFFFSPSLVDITAGALNFVDT